MAQHLFFHSLHQFEIPSEAPAIFGVTDAEFRQSRILERRQLSQLPRWLAQVRYVFVCSIHAPGMRMTVNVR